MTHVSAKESILGSFIERTVRGYGAIVFEVRAILIERDVSVSLVDVTDRFTIIRKWNVTDPADVAETVRAVKRADPYLSGCVFLDDGETCTLVDDDTLKPAPLFGVVRRVAYALKEMP